MVKIDLEYWERRACIIALEYYQTYLDEIVDRAPDEELLGASMVARNNRLTLKKLQKATPEDLPADCRTSGEGASK